MNANTLVIVDMQNDFVTGSLGSKDAEKIVPNVVAEIEKGWEYIIFTRDTHTDNYLETSEGKALPVKHCISKTNGWELVPEVQQALDAAAKKGTIIAKAINKPTFGSFEWRDRVNKKDCTGIEIIGLCTDICVASNALILKAMFPSTPIGVKASCCAGVTPEKHEAALEVMRSCQVEIL